MGLQHIKLASPELVILPHFLPALDSLPSTRFLLVLLVLHVGRIFAGHVIDLMYALVTGRNHIYFRLGFVHVVPNFNLEVGPRSGDTLIRLSSDLTLLVIIVAVQVRRVDLNLLLSLPKRLICRLHHRILLIFGRAQSH